MRLAIFAVFLAASCAETTYDELSGRDGDPADTGPTDTVPEDSTVVATPAQICADSLAYAGKRIRIEAAPVERYTNTAAGCSCCNSMIISLVYTCSDDYNDEIRLEGGPTFPAVTGEVVAPDELDGNDQLASLIEQTSTNFGCAGQQCFERCTPEKVRQLSSVTGGLKLNPGEPYRTLVVESATFF